MGWNDHVNWELNDAIQDLLDEGLLAEGTPGYGIAQKVINEGYDSLSPKQKYVFDTHVGKPLAKRTKELEVRRVIESNPE
ncbi:hypothetical protein HU764_004875 [Pseudomonas sp. SWRI100]|uniref:hypothetical protein n=1 Tax=Pseudomonas TaxID=286 RepID=UPI001646B533|nr:MULTISPECIES: hypothetical protein [Pseudomonas]MBC3496186.1 hypothetical protein [Pseudomonas sp. SWRI67]MBV4525436.1 hypothetical protein [Pseudomonas kermanshahensis]